MPSAAAMARSSGVVMKPRTRSALAPTYTVLTVTVALSSFGYWRTFRPRIACRPATMISTLTTIASTGRRRKRSVSFMASAVRGVRLQLRLRLHAVVHHHGRVVPQLESPGAHHVLAGVDALVDGDEVTARRARAHELLTRDLDRLAVGALVHPRRARLLVFDDEHRIAERRVDDRRRRHRHHLRVRRLDHLDGHEAARPRRPRQLRDRGADLHVA